MYKRNAELERIWKNEKQREGIKAIYVGEQAKIIKGINKGKKGKVIMADAETNVVKLQINDQMVITATFEEVKQEENYMETY